MIAKSAQAQKGYRVLIADDHPVVRQGLRRLLESQAGVEKSDADSDLLSAIEDLWQGKPFFTSRLAASMTDSFLQWRTAEATPLPGVPLTNREVEIVQLLSEGKSNKEVASVLGVSTRTVESHRNHIMHKMSFESFSDVVRFAIRNNLIEA
jgi:DNA-binding NarL/FixJ family response regulator